MAKKVCCYLIFLGISFETKRKFVYLRCREERGPALPELFFKRHPERLFFWGFYFKDFRFAILAINNDYTLFKVYRYMVPRYFF